MLGAQVIVFEGLDFDDHECWIRDLLQTWDFQWPSLRIDIRGRSECGHVMSEYGRSDCGHVMSKCGRSFQKMLQPIRSLKVSQSASPPQHLTDLLYDLSPPTHCATPSKIYHVDTAIDWRIEFTLGWQCRRYTPLNSIRKSILDLWSGNLSLHS